MKTAGTHRAFRKEAQNRIDAVRKIAQRPTQTIRQIRTVKRVEILILVLS